MIASPVRAKEISWAEAETAGTQSKRMVSVVGEEFCGFVFVNLDDGAGSMAEHENRYRVLPTSCMA